MRGLRRTNCAYRQRVVYLSISRCRTYKDQELVSDVFRAPMGAEFVLHDHSQALGEKVLRFVLRLRVVLLTRDFLHALLDDQRKDFLDSSFAESKRQKEQQATDGTDDWGQMPT